MNIQQQLQERLGQALTGLVPDTAPYVAMLKPAQDTRFGDYQANCAMSLKKALGQSNAREIAQQIVERLPVGDVLEKPEIAGPGFINLRLRNEWLARQLQAMAVDERLAVTRVDQPRVYVIDYSSPNVAKPMHVGHLRSTIIGDALTRLLRFLGHTVITDNHLGDWGTQFGIILYGYKHYLDKAAFQADPTGELARLYLHVRSLFKKPSEDDETDTDDPVQEACRQETAKLHAGDPENLRLWNNFMPLCRELINQVYRRLDVSFDHFHGESFYNPMLAGVVSELQQRGIAKESEGAIVVWHGDNEPPSLIRKRDGAYTYTTSDLATIRYRVEQFKAEVILYVVDFRQQLHFKHVFDIARRWGYEVELEHVQFGTVMGKDRKPFKTREGGIVGLDELLDEAVAHAKRVYKENRQAALERGQEVPDLTPEELHRIYEAVGYGAVKYADLCQNRSTDYVFDWDKMMATDGNTATYMQYAYARNRSIFHKGGVDEKPFRTNPPLPTLEHAAERALAMYLLRFEEALLAAAVDYRPSHITGYLWDLAKSYSGFFQNCPVLKAETPQLRQSRLLLCDLTARVIQSGLGLLGIRTVERM
jgi:arginyl-tRNA synthetase